MNAANVLFVGALTAWGAVFGDALAGLAIGLTAAALGTAIWGR